MASRNQNRPPRSPSMKKECTDDVPFDKRRIGTGRTVGPVNTGRVRQAFAAMNNRQAAASDMGSTEGLDCGTIEFTKEEVEALLNEKPKAKMFDLKAKLEQMTEHIKRFKLCIKWFQKVDENHVIEKEKIENMLECTEKKLSDTEMEMKNRETELNGTILALRQENALLQEKVAKQESEKLGAIEARVAVEKLQASQTEQLAHANRKFVTFKNLYKLEVEHSQRLYLFNVQIRDHNNSLQERLGIL